VTKADAGRLRPTPSGSRKQVAQMGESERAVSALDLCTDVSSHEPHWRRVGPRISRSWGYLRPIRVAPARVRSYLDDMRGRLLPARDIPTRRRLAWAGRDAVGRRRALGSDGRLIRCAHAGQRSARAQGFGSSGKCAPVSLTCRGGADGPVPLRLPAAPSSASKRSCSAYTRVPVAFRPRRRGGHWRRAVLGRELGREAEGATC
jgi:hypothetical protein